MIPNNVDETDSEKPTIYYNGIELIDDLDEYVYVPTRRCNGKYCLGKFLPLNRFHASKSSNIGKKNECKMCTDAKYLKDFVPGICIRCKKQHNCNFGSGIYCSRICATGRNASTKTQTNAIPDNTKYRKCSNPDCSKKDEFQPIENFYKRDSKSNIRRFICKYCALEAVRKCQTSLNGFIKHSISSAKKASSHKWYRICSRF